MNNYTAQWLALLSDLDLPAAILDEALQQARVVNMALSHLQRSGTDYDFLTDRLVSVRDDHDGSYHNV